MNLKEYKERNKLLRDRNLQAIERARIISIQYDLTKKSIFDKKLKEVACYGKTKKKLN